MIASSPLFSQRVQAFFPVLIAVLAVIGLSLIGDVLVGMVPFRTADVQWRFLVFAGVLGMAPQVALLLMVTNGIAILGGLRQVVRGAAVVALAVAGVLLILVLFFGLDYLTFRRMIPEANKHRTDMSTLKTAVFGGWFGLMFIWVGMRGWQLSKKEDTLRRAEGDGLVVGQD